MRLKNKCGELKCHFFLFVLQEPRLVTFWRIQVKGEKAKEIQVTEQVHFWVMSAVEYKF
jgi:hypothetical protein